MDYPLRCTDCNNNLVVFTRRNYNKHRKRHPELRNREFFPGRVKQTLKKPTFIIKGKTKDTICYYYEEYTVNGKTRYTKVVVDTSKANEKNTLYVMTAFRPDSVKEDKYGYKRKYHKRS